MALPRSHRLRRRQEFHAVYQGGVRRSTFHFTLRALRQSGAVNLNCPTQLGISVSQKVSKRAVIRNRIKRRIRAAFQQLLPCLSSGWQLVIVVKPAAAECEYEQILQELKQLLISAEVTDGS